MYLLRFLKPYSLFIIFVSCFNIAKCEFVSLQINDAYSGLLNSTTELIFRFNKIDPINPSRVHISSQKATKDFPILVVVRQQKQVLSWQLPLLVDTQTGELQFNHTSRTLCPDFMAMNNIDNNNKMAANSLSVSLSTSSEEDLDFSLDLLPENEFYISTGEKNEVEISPSAPKIFFYKFPVGEAKNGSLDQTDTVLLRVESNSTVCMYVSVQNSSCPVYDLEHDIRFEGLWETVSSRGGLTVPKQKFPNGFFIIFVSKSEDFSCTGKVGTPGVINRNKRLIFSVLPGVTERSYIMAVSITVLTALLVYLFTGLFLCFISRKNRTLSYSIDAIDAREQISNPIGDILTPASDISRNFEVNSDNSSLDETEYDTITEAESVREIFRTKSVLFVSDLARKTPRVLQKKSYLYLWQVLTAAVFYGLPVIQLVITYEKVINQTGNQDLCYYNFLCAHPLGLLSDFNHVFSNIGYVCLGILFCVLVFLRERKRFKDFNFESNYGIPQHHGLFYSMGCALIMEGILSGSYHICPNHTNFQFDSSFMYVISVLCMIKIYQNRHPDINATAYVTFFSLALVIFLGMLGILVPTLYFWITFTIIHLSVCLILTIQIYYMGVYKLDRGVFVRVFRVLRNDFSSGAVNLVRPVYKGRMCLLLLGNLWNWLLAILGLMHHDRDFATYLLAIFMSNTLLYTLFYIIMKILHKERILPHACVFILLATLFWGAATYFFIHKSISWALTPAESRQYNQSCQLLNFYDPHDIWHFLSAFAMFFSFMILLTLDDDLTHVHRSKIHVF